MKELIVTFPSAKRTVGCVRQCEQGSKSRSGAESPKAVSGYGLPRYHGKRFVRTSQSGFAHANQAGWYREKFVPDANGIRAFFNE